MHCLYFICESKFYARKNYAAVWKSTIRQVVEVASSSKYLIFKYLQSATRLHILTTAKIYQLDTYNKVNLFNRTVPVIATMFWET